MGKQIVVTLANGEKAGETLKQLTFQAAALKKEINSLKPGTEDFIKASNSLNQVKDRMSDIDKQVKSTTSASDSLKKAWNTLPGASFFNQISDSFGLAKQGIGGLTSGFGMLGKAIIATGIGALVIAVMGLIQWFSKTETGADLLAKAMAVVESIFRQMTESISRLLKGDIVGFFRGITTEMVDQAKAASSLADALDNLEEKESAFNVVQKAGLRDKAELLKMTKDETLALDARVKAIDRARGITKALNDEEIKNQRERLRIISGGEQEISDSLIKILEKTGLTMENQKLFFKKGNITQDDLNEANQALAKFLEIQQSAFDEERELLTQRNKLTRKELKENASLRKDAQKDQEQQLAQEDAIFLGMQDALDKTIAQLESHEKAKELLDKKTKAEQAQRDKEAYDEKDRQRKEDQEKELQSLEFKRGLNEVQRQLASQALGATIELMSLDQKARKENAAAIKAFTIAQIIVDTEREIAGYYANPASTATLGAIGTIRAVMAVIRAGVSIAKVASSQFYTGGYTGNGGKYEPKGIVHGGEVVWSQEDVARFGGVQAVEAIRPTSNMMRGYYMGGPVSPFSNNTGRGPIPSGNASSSAAAMGFDYDQMAAAFDRRVDNKMKWIRVQNVVTETQDAMKVVNRIKAEADV